MSNDEEWSMRGVKLATDIYRPKGDTLTIQRLRNKLRKQSTKMIALREELDAVKRELKTAKLIPAQDYQRDLERAMKNILTNMRLIPMLGINGRDKIVDIKVSNQE